MSNNVSGGQSTTDALCVNTIRGLAMDAIQKANSGHPGAPMGLAAAAYVLWTRYLKHNPKNSDWLDRDRFVLSGGHASMLLYSLLYLSGYDLDLEEIKNFRQWGSKTPGHPEYGHTDGVETTTGPLGQGVANAVGMAMAESHLAACFNRTDHAIVDHHTYVMCGDGDLMEGVAAEAASLAGHLGLGKLICIYDDNGISIEGSTAIAFTEDVGMRFEAYGWQVLTVDDGNDIQAISGAIEAARVETGKPSLIKLKTEIAYGSPNKQGTADAHGAPLGEEEIILAKQNLGIPADESFRVPDEVRSHFGSCMEKGIQAEAGWLEAFQAYKTAHPELADQWVDAISGFLPEDWRADIPAFAPDDGPLATRAASGQVLNALAAKVPALVGGSADLAPSNKTYLTCSHEFQKTAYDGRNIRFGVREHAMGAVIAGMFLHNGLRPYGGTFLVFADYVRPAIRMASLMKLPLIYVFTHDSIAVGEDGPTHQPVEHVAALRAIPGLTVIRPADATETAKAWCQALQTTDHPVALILSRQKLPILESALEDQTLQQGAYILSDCEGTPDMILIASGSEVQLVLEAQKELARDKIAARVVSMPSWELFERTAPDYRRQVLPPTVKVRLAVEAGITMGWEKYVGDQGDVIGMTGFGASAPGSVVMEKFGFSTANVVARAKKLLGR
ncbi:MAG: transketolase [Desulfobacterales bacterium]|nr:transketolase [Desulfobacterales bacterium]